MPNPPFAPSSGVALDPQVVEHLAYMAQVTAGTVTGLVELQSLTFWQNELRSPRYDDPRKLSRHGFKVYSQSDEDGIIAEIFRRIGETDRRFVEFGVQSGSECNTLRLLLLGWTGLWIEASATSVASIRQTHAAYLSDGRLHVTEAFVTAENIDVILEAARFGGEIDLLSIDIDGNDYWVWKSIRSINPRVVVIEYNATLRPPLSVVMPYEPVRSWDGTNYFGASLEALAKLGRSLGYRLVGCNFSGVNAFFVRDDLCDDRFHDPATAEELYEPPRYFMRFYAGHPARFGPFEAV